MLAPVSGAWAALSASVTLITGDPTAIYPGQTTRLLITLANSNTAAAANSVAFSSSLPGLPPDGLTVAGLPVYTCSDPSTVPATTTVISTGVTAVIGTQAISLSGGTVPARANNTDGTCLIAIPVTAGTSTGAAATYTYSIASGAVTGNDGNPVANSGTVGQSVNVNALAKPALAKSFASGTLTLGGAPTTLTITLTNPNPVAIANYAVTDNFPQLGGASTIRVAATPNAAASCNNGGAAPVFAPAAGDTALAASGTIPAASGGVNGSCSLTVQVEAAQTNGQYSTGAQTNSINATTQFSNALGIPASANATASITVNSPLRVSKAFAHPFLASFQTDSFTITLYNDGASPLTVSALTDDPIDGTSAGNTSASGLKVQSQSTNCAGGAVSATANATGIALSGGLIPAGGNCAITVSFLGTNPTPDTPVTYTNFLASGAVNVGNPAIVSQAASATLLVADNLRILKSASPAQAAPGNPVNYVVTVQNFSATALANLTVTDHLANGMSLLTGTIGGNNFTPVLGGAGCSGLTLSGSTGAAAPVFTIASVPARPNANTPAACTISFWAMTATGAANGSSTSNTINAGDACFNAGASCNGAPSGGTPGTVTSTVLSATKSFGPSGSMAEGTVATLTITLSNASANPLTALSISDTLPLDAGGGNGQLRIATPANAASNCGSPTIVANPGATSLAMNSGTVPARAANGTGANGTCFIKVDVTGPAGTYNNVATAAASGTYADGSAYLIGPVATNTATLVYTSALNAAKFFNPASISSGGRSTVTVRLGNTGTAALTAVAVNDPLPAGMVVAPAPNAYSTCAGAPAVTAAAGAAAASLSGATIAAGGTCDLLFDVVASGGAAWTNTIAPGNITAAGGLRNITPVTATLGNAAPTSLTVALTTNPGTLTFPGAFSQLTITLTAGSQGVSGLRLTNYFTNGGTAGGSPSGLVVASTTGASTTCPGGVLGAKPGATSISLSGVSLAVTASCSITVNVTSTGTGGVTDTIPVNAIVTDQGFSNSGVATTSLATQSNLGVVKQFLPNVVQPGTRARLRITFFNPTGVPVTGISLVDSLPAGLSVPAGASPVSNCPGASIAAPSGGTVQISGASLVSAATGSASSCYAEIDVLAAGQGDYLNTIPAGAVTASAGGAAVTNSQPSSDTLRAKFPLTVHAAIGGSTLDPGGPDGFTTGQASRPPGAAAPLVLRIDNPNATQLTGLALSDLLPAGLVIAQTPNAATTCTGATVLAAPSATGLRLTGGTLPANGFCTVSVNVLSNVSGGYVDTMAAGTVTTNEGVTNSAAISQAGLLVSTPPTVAAQFAAPVIPSGGSSTLTLYLGNSNSVPLTLNSALTDTLPSAPGPLQVAAVPNLAQTCPGTVSVSPGGNSLVYASGSQIPPGGCTISVNVTGLVPGNYIDTVPAGSLLTNLGSNQAAANSALSISPLGFVAGRVFQDNKVVPNGVFQTTSDVPLAGVAVELRIGSGCAGALVALPGASNPALTDSLGNYLFSGLPPGTYSACEPAQPAGTVNSITTAGSIAANAGSTGTAGVASNPTATTSQVAGIVLNGDGSGGAVSGSAGNNFAEIVLSSISGTVFMDANNNGLQDPGDPGIPGAAVALLDGQGTQLATSTTDSQGNYTFAGLNPGTYTVLEPAQPAGSANGLTRAGPVPHGGTPGTPTVVTATPSRISAIVLPPNTLAAGNNFAEIPLGRIISGFVFLDYQRNGVLGPAPDHGVGAVALALTGTDINGNPFNLGTISGSDGSYTFSGVPEGASYTVTMPGPAPASTAAGVATAGSTGGVASSPAAGSLQIASIGLAGANGVSANNNFALLPGNAPDLSLAITHQPAAFGAGSATGYFTLAPANIGSAATSGAVTVVDTLPAGMQASAATGAGWSCSISGQTVTCTSTQAIAAGANASPIQLRVAVAPGSVGQVLANTAVISGGQEPAAFAGNNSATDTVAIAGSASVQGTVWRDLNHNRILDSGEARLPGWTVELLQSGAVVATSTTDANGAYAFAAVAPGSAYQIRFRSPGAASLYGVPVPNEAGAAFADGVTGPGNPAGADTRGGTLNGLTLLAGSQVLQQSLPVDPTGIVYDAVTRNPVAGASVTISGPAGFSASNLVGGNLSVTTDASGFYQFLLLSSAPAGTYKLAVTVPGGYLPGPSAMIPPCAAPLVLGAGPAPAVVQSATTAPASSVPNQSATACPTSSATLAAGAGSTQYFSSFTFNPALAASALIGNHIPIDPILAGAIAMSKTTPLLSVAKGGLVPYTITAGNTLAATLGNIDVHDRLPAGFAYRRGSASINGVRLEPMVAGGDLVWKSLTFAAGEKKTIKLLAAVGAGVSEGTYINRASAMNNIVGATVSNTAQASVRVIPDSTFDCSDLIGKVFDDRNANGYQDPGEPGIGSVRLATARGLQITTDSEGRFHIPCAAIPQSDHGSNFVLKLDERSLPSGYRLTTANPGIARLTSGKMGRIDFGASVHAVVRLELDRRAFVETGNQLLPQWESRLDELMPRLAQKPCVLRIAYKADGRRDREFAIERVRELSRRIAERYSVWRAPGEDGGPPRPPLIIETEIASAGQGGAQ
jgi:uncharacterized repeat protein (TIGR01451 family)